MSREPRDLALHCLYQADLLAREPSTTGLPAKAARLVRGVTRERPSLDATLDETSEAWPLQRMPAVDRTILRMGLYELRHDRGTPTAVVISEAVRMAKTYSTERSGAFVNGMLGKLADRERAED